VTLRVCCPNLPLLMKCNSMVARHNPKRFSTVAAANVFVYVRSDQSCKRFSTPVLNGVF
jgi:hypothetical protein